MIINTELSTVTFTKDETFTVERLGDIIKVIEDSQLAGLSQWERDLQTPDSECVVYKAVVKADSHNGFYDVTWYADKHYECTCPDFEHRGRKDGVLVSGYECKHIRRHIWQAMGY